MKEKHQGFVVDEYSISVKHRIKKERKAQKISQVDMAEHLCIGLRTYQEKENPRYPKRCFDVCELGKIANRLNEAVGALAISTSTSSAHKEALVAIAWMEETAIEAARQADLLKLRVKTYGLIAGD